MYLGPLSGRVAMITGAAAGAGKAGARRLAKEGAAVVAPSATAQLGMLDILVSNARQGDKQSCIEVDTDEEFERSLTMNCSAAKWSMGAARRSVRARGLILANQNVHVVGNQIFIGSGCPVEDATWTHDPRLDTV